MYHEVANEVLLAVGMPLDVLRQTRQDLDVTRVLEENKFVEREQPHRRPYPVPGASRQLSRYTLVTMDTNAGSPMRPGMLTRDKLLIK